MPRPGDETRGSAASVDKVRHVQQHPPGDPMQINPRPLDSRKRSADCRLRAHYVLKSSAVLGRVVARGFCHKEQA